MITAAKSLLALITLAMVTACATDPRVQSKHDGSLDFSQYESFNFSSPTAIENPDLGGQLELYFSAAVEQQMRLKGLVRSDQPDILINVSVDVDDVSAPPARANNCPRYDDYYSRRSADRYAGEGRRPMCIYTEGTIMIDMVDVTLNRKIWEGVSRVRMDERDRGASLLRSVVTDVATMFEGPQTSNRNLNPIHPYNPASASRGIIATVPRGDG
jgi:hypothetical protein